MDNSNEMVFCPTGVLKPLCEHTSYKAVENEIAAANLGGKTIDRRKLKRIVGGDEGVSLTIRELRALDAFLTPLGFGLADKPIFDKPSPLRSIAARGLVTMAIGAYKGDSEDRNELNRWDILAMTTLLQAIETARPRTPVHVEDMRFKTERPRLPRFLDANGPSVCCIGSPRACYAAEFMLAQMLDVQPFDDKSNPNLPFRFIWSPQAAPPNPCAFRGEPEVISSIDEQLALDIRANKAWGALAVGQKLYPVRRHKRKDSAWATHGIVLSQTRPAGQVWMVIAGMSGPATYGCAKTVAEDRVGAVPELKHGVDGVRRDVIECTVKNTGDQRELMSYRVVDSRCFSRDDF